MASSDIRGLLAIAAGVGTGIAAKRQNERLLEQETERTAMLSRGVASTLGAIDGLDMLDTERAALRARASTAYQYAASDDPKLRALGEQMIPKLTQALGESATRNDAERIALEAAEIEQANLERQNEQARIEGMYSRTQDLIGERTNRLDPIADGIERMERVRNLIDVGSPAAVESSQLALAAFLNEGRPTDKDAEAVQKLGGFIERQKQALAGLRGEGAREIAQTQMNALIDAIQEPMRARAQNVVRELDERAKHGRLPVVESLWNAGYDRGFYTDPTGREQGEGARPTAARPTFGGEDAGLTSRGVDARYARNPLNMGRESLLPMNAAAVGERIASAASWMERVWTSTTTGLSGAELLTDPDTGDFYARYPDGTLERVDTSEITRLANQARAQAEGEGKSMTAEEARDWIRRGSPTSGSVAGEIQR